MTLLDGLKADNLRAIASMTNPNNQNLREVVENVLPEDLDPELLRKIAKDLRVSEILTASIVGESEKK